MARGPVLAGTGGSLEAAGPRASGFGLRLWAAATPGKRSARQSNCLTNHSGTRPFSIRVSPPHSPIIMPPRSSAYGFLVAALALFGCQAPPKDLPAASAPTTEARLVESRRIAGSPEPFAQIGAFAFGAHGEVALVDGERSKVLVFDSAGHLQREFGSAGNGPGEFRNAHLVAIAPDGEVMVADIGNARLTRWSPAGKLIASTPLPTPAAALEWTDSGFAGAVDRGTGRVLFRIHPGSAGRDSLQSFARYQVADPLDHPPEAVTCETCALIITPELRALVSAPDTIYRVALTDREGKPIREWRREGVPPRPAARAKLERAKKLLGPSGLSA